jgi:hypothetical protein
MNHAKMPRRPLTRDDVADCVTVVVGVSMCVLMLYAQHHDRIRREARHKFVGEFLDASIKVAQDYITFLKNYTELIRNATLCIEENNRRLANPFSVFEYHNKCPALISECPFEQNNW